MDYGIETCNQYYCIDIYLINMLKQLHAVKPEHCSVLSFMLGFGETV